MQTSLTVLEAKYEKSFFNRTVLVSILENVRLTLKKSSILDFDNAGSLTIEEYYNLTVLTKEQFEVVSCHLTSIRHSAVRPVRTCLAILMTKLRTGLPNHIIGTIFSLKKMSHSKIHIAHYCHLNNINKLLKNLTHWSTHLNKSL